MRKNLAIDILIFVTYVVVSFPEITGVGLHEWLALPLCVLFVVHCIQHFDWAIDVTKGAKNGISWSRQGNLVLDVIVLVTFCVVMVSGLGISGAVLPSIGLFCSGYYLWGPLHAFSAKVLLALLLVHVVAHWRWIVKCACGKGRSDDGE